MEEEEEVEEVEVEEVEEEEANAGWSLVSEIMVLVREGGPR